MTRITSALLDELATIDAALLDDDATDELEARGQELVQLANAAPKLLVALRFALPYMEDLAASSDNEFERLAAQIMRIAIAHAEGE